LRPADALKRTSAALAHCPFQIINYLDPTYHVDYRVLGAIPIITRNQAS